MQNPDPVSPPRTHRLRTTARRLALPLLMLLSALPVHAQTGSDPWENAVNVLKTSFTGTIATHPQRDMNEVKREVAEKFDLPYVNDGIQIPDARIVYDIGPKPGDDMDQGRRTGHEDIEVLTAAYSPGHLRAKAQAGFRNYASSSDRASVTAKVEHDHNLMQNILEL